MEERLQKLLSQAGVCSRRSAESYILAGRVSVNGVPSRLGDKAVWGKDEITVDGMPICAPEQNTYLMLNKPRGFVTTLSDEKGRRSVADLIENCGVRVWPVGRLDLDSEGLLLLTNDGALTQCLIHPSHEVEKEYLVRVQGDVCTAIPILTQDMRLDGEQLHGAKVRVLRKEGTTSLLSITIHEGKNRQVRRMCAHTGLEVLRLKRIREGQLRLDRELSPGQWRPLTASELHSLSDRYNSIARK